jgi:lipopolysaccharide export system permease protein
MASIDKYIIKKLVISLGFVCLGMLSLAWLIQILKMLDEAIIRGADILTFLKLTLSVIPNVLAQILPLSVFIATTFVLINLARENETIILITSGIKANRIFRPFLYFGTLSTVLLILFSLFLAPAGMRYAKHKMFQLKNDLSSTIIRDGLFSMPARGLTVYAQRKDKDNSIYGILVHDNRNSSNPITYTANKGYFINENNSPKLILIDGSIQHRDLLNPETGITIVTFERNEYLFSEFLPEDMNFNLDSSQRFLHELFNPKKDDIYAQNRLNVLWAVGHHKISQLLHPITLILLSFVFLIGRTFEKNEKNNSILYIISLAFIFQLIDFFILGLAQNGVLWVVMLYFLPLISLVFVLSYSFKNNLINLLRSN